MSRLDDMIDALLYDDATTIEKVRFIRAAYKIATLMFMAWAVGTFTSLGFYGFARTGDIDTKIKEAITPINSQLDDIQTKELAGIKNQLQTNEWIQKRILASQLTSQLRELQKLRCKTTDFVLRTRIDVTIDSAQQEYITLSHERYPIPGCKEL